MTRIVTSFHSHSHTLQIEGAFVQGYGLFVMEDLRWSPNGQLLTKGPGYYKIPGFGDVPLEFNVTLLKNSSNPDNICSSKVSLNGELVVSLDYQPKIPTNRDGP